MWPKRTKTALIDKWKMKATQNPFFEHCQHIIDKFFSICNKFFHDLFSFLFLSPERSAIRGGKKFGAIHFQQLHKKNRRRYKKIEKRAFFSLKLFINPINYILVSNWKKATVFFSIQIFRIAEICLRIWPKNIYITRRGKNGWRKKW